jgi:hypothetical protein
MAIMRGIGLLLLALLVSGAATPAGAAPPGPEVGACEMWMPVGSRPLVGRWFDVACAFKDRPVQTTQGTVFPAMCDAAGLEDLLSYRSALVEARWISVYGLDVPRQRMSIGGSDCMPSSCPRISASGIGAARLEIGPAGMAGLGPDPVAWIGPDTVAPLDPALTGQVAYWVRISLFEQDKVPNGYSAFE